MNYFVTVHERLKRTSSIKEARRNWKNGNLFIRKNNTFIRYKGGDFDQLITLFAKEKLFLKKQFQTNKPVLVVESEAG